MYTVRRLTEGQSRTLTSGLSHGIRHVHHGDLLMGLVEV